MFLSARVWDGSGKLWEYEKGTDGGGRAIEGYKIPHTSRKEC